MLVDDVTINREDLFAAIWRDSLLGVARDLRLKVHRLKSACEIYSIPRPTSAFLCRRDAGFVDPVDPLPPPTVAGSILRFQAGLIEIPIPEGWNETWDWQIQGMSFAHHRAISAIRRNNLRIAGEPDRDRRRHQMLVAKIERAASRNRSVLARDVANIAAARDERLRKFAIRESDDIELFSLITEGKSLNDMAAEWGVPLQIAKKRLWEFIDRGEKITGLPKWAVLDVLFPRQKGKPGEGQRARYSIDAISLETIWGLAFWQALAVDIMHAQCTDPLAELELALRKNKHRIPKTRIPRKQY